MIAFVGIAFSFSFLAETANASTPSDGQMLIDSSKEELLLHLKQDYPDAQFISEYDANDSFDHQSEVSPFAPAPPLTLLQAYAAISQNHQAYEYFSENQLSSVIDHGGEWMYIVTAELGYGTRRSAQMEGNTLTEYDREHIDLNGDNIVDGWFIWWDASGYDEGTFSYRNTSTNYPWNTMSDSIYIR
ncbi:YolA family protein [Shouchella tritolerans]|nr:YolA family protein [Shouchella tritolerans]